MKSRGKPFQKGHKINLGRTREISDETRKKLSIAHKGKKHTKEHIRKIVEGRRWYKHSEQTKLKMSLAQKGKPRKHWTEENKKKLSEKMKGHKPFNWKGGRLKDGKGYIKVFRPEHPNAQKNGYVMEHRIVMEQSLGRLLRKEEEVHHKNGIKGDNRLENLELVLWNNHKGEVQCPQCLHKFYVK